MTEPLGLEPLSRTWTQALLATGYIPLSPEELRAYLAGELRRLLVPPADPEVAAAIGADLVATDVATPEMLGSTVLALAPHLPAEVLSALVAGYSRAQRERTRDEQESLYQAALLARDRAEAALRASEARFRHEANHDPLTGLPNRLLFGQRLTEAFTAPDPRGDRRIGLCFVDLDGFQAVNDSLGHQIGDGLLLALANRLDERVARPGQLVARLGGDEFVILIDPSTCTDEVIKVADTALTALAEPVVVDDHQLTVSACVGVVEGPVSGTDPAELMRCADMTLHWAKHAGRGRWAVFDPIRNEQEVARYVLSAAMPGALDRAEFYLEYQPLVGLDDGTVRGVEALLRWDHPELGPLPPDRFVALAEETGLIVRLGTYVLEQACREARRWSDADPGAPFVSVNLSVRQIQDPEVVGVVAATLAETGLPATKLQLEITEGAVMGTDDDSLETLRGLAALGVRLAIDDFGTGYSNLAYLHTLPVHELKIAGSFVDGLRLPAEEDCVDARILTKLVDLAHALGLTVTAEGVETPEQAQRLRAIGCDAGQGWHLGRPGPAAFARTPGYPGP